MAGVVGVIVVVVVAVVERLIVDEVAEAKRLPEPQGQRHSGSSVEVRRVSARLAQASPETFPVTLAAPPARAAAQRSRSGRPPAPHLVGFALWERWGRSSIEVEVSSRSIRYE